MTFRLSCRRGVGAALVGQRTCLRSEQGRRDSCSPNDLASWPGQCATATRPTFLMGLVGQAAVSDSSQASTIEDFHTLALSPARSVHDALTSPSASLHDATPSFLKRCSCFDDSTVLPSEPAASHVETCPATTPLPDDFSPQSMNILVGGALAPVHSSPPRNPQPRPRANLRLPSFEALGIAAPHPDRFGGLAFNLDAMNGAAGDPVPDRHPDSELLSAFNNATQLSPTQLRHPLDSKLVLGGSRSIATPIRHDVATLTPPAETGDIQHNPIATAHVSSVPMDSPATGVGNPISQASQPAEQSQVQSPPSSREGAIPTRPRSWIAGALDVVCK